MIGDDIELTVVDIRGDKVRLGITAPTQIPVHRKEIYDAIKLENEQAARLSEREVASLRATLKGKSIVRSGTVAAERFCVKTTATKQARA